MLWTEVKAGQRFQWKDGSIHKVVSSKGKTLVLVVTESAGVKTERAFTGNSPIDLLFWKPLPKRIVRR